MVAAAAAPIQSASNAATGDSQNEHQPLAGILRLPTELLTEIATSLRAPLDVFALRRTCKALHIALGPDNWVVWRHLLSLNGSTHHYCSECTPYKKVAELLSGKQYGCQICLNTTCWGEKVLYRANIFYKRVCGRCFGEHFSK
ncbi:hypothetical protein ABW19_dt0201063 [Dactylella cylindrospora]|nr:hypothetical protein ABW19_dt0201063 [Dactylella cylindrospora]